MTKKHKKLSDKKLFAVLFVVFLYGFSICNWYLHGTEVTEKTEAEIKKIQTGETNAKEAVLALEGTVNEELFLRYPLIEIYGFLQKAMGKQEDNGFDKVRDKNGFLHNGNFWNGHGDDQKELALRVCRLAESLKSSGTKTGAVLWPMKLAEPDARYYGIPYNDYTKLSDSMAAWLRYYGMPLLDLRHLMEETGMSQEEFFYKTDHHWTPPAAFEGYLRVLDWMQEEFGEVLDLTGELHKRESYHWKTYENVMLGSQGQDTGLLYAGGLEDQTVVYPKEEGSYTLKAGTLEEYETKEGSFQEALLKTDLYIKNYKELYQQKATGAYLGSGIQEYASIENHDADLDKSVLLLRDSFAQPVGAFLAQSFRKVDMLWTLEITEEELSEFLSENHYDYVLIAVYPENLTSDAFPFGKEES